MLHFVNGISKASHLGLNVILAHMESEMTGVVLRHHCCRLPGEVAPGYRLIDHEYPTALFNLLLILFTVCKSLLLFCLGVYSFFFLWKNI